LSTPCAVDGVDETARPRRLARAGVLCAITLRHACVCRERSSTCGAGHGSHPSAVHTCTCLWLTGGTRRAGAQVEETATPSLAPTGMYASTKRPSMAAASNCKTAPQQTTREVRHGQYSERTSACAARRSREALSTASPPYIDRSTASHRVGGALVDASPVAAIQRPCHDASAAFATNPWSPPQPRLPQLPLQWARSRRQGRSLHPRRPPPCPHLPLR